MVQCLLCGKEFRVCLSFHLTKAHKISCKEYRKKFPGSPIIEKSFFRNTVWNNPIWRANISKGVKEYFSNEEVRKEFGEKIRKAMTPEVRAKISEKHKKPIIVKCKFCGKEIFYPTTRDFKGNFCSRECKNNWQSKVMKEKWYNNTYRNKMLKVRRSPTVKKLIEKRQKEHDVEVIKTYQDLKKRGFWVYPIDTVGFPIPDLIAVKGENFKVYAIEVTHDKYPEFEKWNTEHPFNDIWWVTVKKKKKV